MGRPVMSLPDLVQTLAKRPSFGAGVLSAYLNTSPSRRRGQSYVTAFQIEAARVHDTLAPICQDAFEGAVGRAERYLTDVLVPVHGGLALFVATEAPHVQTAGLVEAPQDEVAWGPRPQLWRAAEALDDHKRIAVAVLGDHVARISTLFLGEIEENQLLRYEAPVAELVAAAPHLSGRWPLPGPDRLIDLVIDNLMGLMDRSPFDQLFLAAPEEVFTAVSSRLPDRLRSPLSGAIALTLDDPEAEVLQALRTAATAAERQAEVNRVSELLTLGELIVRHRAMGVEATLEALNEHRAHTVMITSAFGQSGSQCTLCGRLASGGIHCAFCGSDLRPLPELRESIVAHALAADARVEIVRGEAEALLEEHGGLAAGTRY